MPVGMVHISDQGNRDLNALGPTVFLEKGLSDEERESSARFFNQNSTFSIQNASKSQKTHKLKHKENFCNFST